MVVTHGLNLSKLLQYPILPEAPCFAHPDGSIHQGNKAVVFHDLKGLVPSNSPRIVNTAIVDGMFLLKTMSATSTTFAGLARKILISVMKLTTHRADLCFDVYGNNQSIKDLKRKERGDEKIEIIFNFGPMQKTPKDMKNFLLLSEFKRELLNFFFKEYERQEYEERCSTVLSITSAKNSFQLMVF